MSPSTLGEAILAPVPVLGRPCVRESVVGCGVWLDEGGVETLLCTSW
ncbi:MAG TPA: hypothetical protein VJN19_12980 [Propionibacteriaceae bacterium]|nr:hypothetical protein [Propionibacteriaceae bacterium]